VPDAAAFPIPGGGGGMSSKPKIRRRPTVKRMATDLRDEFKSGGQDFVLLFAYNGTGKTRLSTAFKNAEKTRSKDGKQLEGDTLYFNAFTEDLFSWDNDLEYDLEPRLLVNSNSRLISGFSDLNLGESIEEYFRKYCSAKFEITRYSAEEVAKMADPDSPSHSLYRRFGLELEARPKHVRFKAGTGDDWIKISRGEERIFIWSVFLAILKQVLGNEGSYHWVKYLYIDDPVSSLDDNNTIAVACDLAELLRRAKRHTKLVKESIGGPVSVEREVNAPIKAVVSTHHALFFNVLVNELKKDTCQTYFLDRPRGGTGYTLRKTGDTPFLNHIALLSELRNAADPRSGKLYTYHFNMLRGILEKTAVFFGKHDFSECLKNDQDRGLFSRALNLQSHGQHSHFEPLDMPENDKELFRRILDSFLDNHHKFDLARFGQ
jgi:hypothetical protein